MDITPQLEFAYLNDQIEFGAFACAGLTIYMDLAIRILHARLEINPHLDHDICLNVGRESFSQDQRSILNSCLADVLDLITTYVHSNQEPCITKNYFLKNGFQYDVFVDYLIMSIENAQAKKLQESFQRHAISPTYEDIKQMMFDDAVEREEFERQQKEWVEIAKKRRKDFKYGKNRLTEKEVRAIGVLYAIEIILNRWRLHQEQPIAEYEILKFAHAVSKVQKLFNFREQYIASIIGGLQKNDQFPNHRKIMQELIIAYPSAKPKALRALMRQEVEKRGMSPNAIPLDSTLDSIIREIRLKLKNSKN